MAQKIVKVKSIGEKHIYNFGIDTSEHLWIHRGLVTKNCFNMPHAYSYSLMGYVQAALKYYYPLEFWTASLNTIDRGQEKHGHSSLGKYINSIEKANITVHSPNINKSGIMFESDDTGIYFALSYIKEVSKGAATIIEHRPYRDWENFLEKAIKYKINKRIVRGLIFSGAVDFDSSVDERSYKWLLYLAEKGKKKLKSGKVSWNKKIKEELDDYKNNMPKKYQLIREEYEYCKYSFNDFRDVLINTKFKNLKTVSERDTRKRLWVLAAFIDNIQVKKSKKSGKEYVFVTITDFHETIGVFCFFEESKKRLLKYYNKGDLVKIVIKNDNNWLKLASSHDIGGKPAIEKISLEEL